MSQRKARKRFRAQVPVATSIKRLLRTYGLEKDIADTSLLHAWPQIVGERISKFTKAIKVDKSRTLHVAVAHSGWMHELSFLKGPIMASIEEWRRTAKQPVKPLTSLHFFLSRR